MNEASVVLTKVFEIISSILISEKLLKTVDGYFLSFLWNCTQQL
jgi:hypothetical protein